MSEPVPRRGASGFDPRVMLALLAFGALAFLATLYFIGAGDTGERGNDGSAHAAANGLNGYAGLVRLLELDGFDTRTSRSPTGHGESGLLVLTPPPYADPTEVSAILQSRAYIGQTLVILPKWQAAPIPPQAAAEVEVEDGWVSLKGAFAPPWAAALDLPFAVNASVEAAATGLPRWNGLGLSGQLPDRRYLALENHVDQIPQVADAAGRAMVVQTTGTTTQYAPASYPVTIVAEPDLLNNYGLADRQRAALARALVVRAAQGKMQPVTFDLTLNGFGGSQNLLTLAFRPPFLAATLCLLLALLIVAWRAFRRFGPAAADLPATGFGKRLLVANGAGLILRARRYHLLAEPYIALSQRRLAARLGLRRPDPALIDQALARRLPDQEPFSPRAATLRGARSIRTITRAAAALKDLEGNSRHDDDARSAAHACRRDPRRGRQGDRRA